MLTTAEGDERMLRYVILGFLANNSLTGYDIKQAMLQSTSNFIKANLGSIYPSLEKLEKEGLIFSTSSKGGKKGYEINEAGMDVFIEWLSEPIEFMKSLEDILAKVYFYGNLPKEKAVELLEELVNNINKKIQVLSTLEAEIKETKGFYEISTLNFGLEHLKFMSVWFEKLLREAKFR